MRIRAFILMLLVTGLFGCGDKPFGQDPLEGYPDSVRNGIPPEKRPEKGDTNPMCKECYAIEVNSGEPVFISDKQESRISIKVTVFKSQFQHPIKSFDIVAGNLNEFEGADLKLIKEIPLDDLKEKKIAVKEYEFVWTPKSKMVDPLSRRFLRLKLVTDSDLALVEDEVVPITIEREFEIPKITDMSFSKEEISEGERAMLTLTVIDNDSTQSDPPKVRFVRGPKLIKNDIATYLTFDSLSYDTSTSTWSIRYNLDLSVQDVTRGIEDFYVAASVISKYGQVSAVKEESITVRNLLRKPSVSLLGGAKYTLAAGSKLGVTYSVYDFREEGAVSSEIVESLSTFPGLVTLNCQNPTYRSYYQVCQFLWDLPVDTVSSISDYTITVRSTNTSNYATADPKKEVYEQTFKVTLTGLKQPEPPQPPEAPVDNGGQP